MGFVKPLEEIAAGHLQKFVFYDAEVLTVYFETKPEIIQPATIPCSQAASWPNRTRCPLPHMPL